MTKYHRLFGVVAFVAVAAFVVADALARTTQEAIAHLTNAFAKASAKAKIEVPEQDLIFLAFCFEKATSETDGLEPEEIEKMASALDASPEQARVLIAGLLEKMKAEALANPNPTEEAMTASGNSVKMERFKPEVEPTKVEENTSVNSVKKMRWNAPDAEEQWASILENPVANMASSSSNRLAFSKGFDSTQAEGQLEAFGTRYMPNLFAQYQEVRAKFLELQQMMAETFSHGSASDPTGGEMFAKARKKVAEAGLRMSQRRDELCFFLLFHQAGIFAEDVLAKYDARPISIRMEPESDEWPNDTPEANTALSDADATFAAKYLPETLAGYQRLCGLFAAGAKQYAELRQTALALCAPRARNEFLMLKFRLEVIRTMLQNYQQDISRQRLEHAFGDASAEQLATVDQANAVKLQKYEREMGVKAYVARNAERLFVTLPGGAMMEMVWCPPGTFMMGSDEGFSHEEPHQVTLTNGFWMGKTEVTQVQWKSVMGNNPSKYKGDNLPVENVSWNNCRDFCMKTEMALPTEEQWEYACRAGSTGPYGGTGNIDEMGWTDRETHPVGTKQPNAWGLYDMHGNVYEWCASWFEEYSEYQKREYGQRVLRGGSWHSSKDECTSFRRSGGYPSHAEDGYGGGYYGFRVVKSISE